MSPNKENANDPTKMEIITSEKQIISY